MPGHNNLKEKLLTVSAIDPSLPIIHLKPSRSITINPHGLWKSLPSEIHSEILRNSTLDELARLALVNRTFNATVKKLLADKKRPENVMPLEIYKELFSYITARQRSTLKSISFIEGYSARFNEKLPSLSKARYASFAALILAIVGTLTLTLPQKKNDIFDFFGGCALVFAAGLFYSSTRAFWLNYCHIPEAPKELTLTSWEKDKISIEIKSAQSDLDILTNDFNTTPQLRISDLSQQKSQGIRDRSVNILQCNYKKLAKIRNDLSQSPELVYRFLSSLTLPTDQKIFQWVNEYREYVPPRDYISLEIEDLETPSFRR